MSENQLQEDQKETSVLISGLAGGISGVIVDCVYYPFETLKTRIQASDKTVDYSKKAKDLNKYKGFSMQMFSSFPFAFLFFFTYDEMKSILYTQKEKQIIKDKNNSENQNTLIMIKNFLAASAAETVANVSRTPFEVVKQQQQVGHDSLVRDTIKQIYKQKGIGGFYSGFNSLLLRDIPFSGIQLTIYELMKQGKQRDLTVFESVSSGAVAAGISAFVTTPMDVVKSKLMTQRDNKYNGMVHCVQTILKEEGAQAFFKGSLYRTLPLSFTGTIFFTMYEQAKNLLYSVKETF